MLSQLYLTIHWYLKYNSYSLCLETGIIREQLHLCLYLRVQARYDNPHTGAVSSLLRTRHMLWWVKVVTIWMNTWQFRVDPTTKSYSTHGMKSPNLSPKRPIDPQEEDPCDFQHKNNRPLCKCIKPSWTTGKLYKASFDVTPFLWSPEKIGQTKNVGVYISLAKEG